MTATTDTAARSNAQLGRQFFEEQDRLRGGPAPLLCSSDYCACIGGQAAVDRTAHEYFARAFYAAFPDLQHSVEDVFATTDRVAVRFVLRGTHRGSFFGVPPTGRPVTVAANVLLHVADGKVTRLFGVFDEAGLLRQIGAID